jgi:hypothetical protein
MGRTPRIARAALALALCAVPVACGDDDTPASTGTTIVVTTADLGPTTTSGNGGSALTTVPAGPTTTAAGTVIEVTVTGNDVQGGGRKQVEKDEPITIRVTSDTADELHVHGYDLKANLAAGVPGEITFTPNAAGVFEIELEHHGLHLLELEVR